MLIILFFFFCIIPIFGLPQCKKSSPPRNIKINHNFTINPIKYNNKELTSFQIADRIVIKENFFLGYYTSRYNISQFCPPNFIIPYKEDYENIISKLGNNAYSTFTNENCFNMVKEKYYLTNTKGNTDTWYSFYLMHLDGEKFNISAFTTTNIGSSNIVIKCILKVPETKIEFPGVVGDIDYNTPVLVKNNGNYFNGYLWKINDNFYDSNNFTYTFKRSGTHMIEFWGNLINGEVIYACDYAYVKKKSISKKQDYNINNVKLIETDFEMYYLGCIYFCHGNSPVATKADGGYYIAVSDKSKIIHILSFNKNDELIKDLNTTKLGFPHVETDYGFVLYSRSEGGYNSYLDLYNKNFELIKTLPVMNNSKDDNKEIDSNTTRQLMRYDSSGKPCFGMRYMFISDNGKLLYTKGRIFLIFGHENWFTDGAHQGDTSATFNDLLEDIDFGWAWGTSHSLSQTATFDENNYITASLCDGNSPWVNVYYLSKTEFRTDPYYYDAVNKKFNQRTLFGTSKLTGKMKGYDGYFPFVKVGGILYFEDYKLYCLVYAKTPDIDKNTSIIYLTSWEVKDKQIVNNKTVEVKVFPKDMSLIQVRSGKLGTDKVFIIYNETNKGGSVLTVPQGNKPKVYIYNIQTLKPLQSDIYIDKLYMNSNEDLHTFNDGVLIWASTNEKGKLVINKIGTPRLDESFDDIDYILTKDDLTKEEKEKEEKEDKNGSRTTLYLIIIGVIISVAILIFVIFILYRYIKKKKNEKSVNVKEVKGPLLMH